MSIGDTKCNHEGCSNEATKQFKATYAMPEYPKYCSTHYQDKWVAFQKDLQDQVKYFSVVDYP